MGVEAYTATLQLLLRRDKRRHGGQYVSLVKVEGKVRDHR